MLQEVPSLHFITLFLFVGVNHGHSKIRMTSIRYIFTPYDERLCQVLVPGESYMELPDALESGLPYNV